MVFENTNLCMIIFIIMALVYLLNNNNKDSELHENFDNDNIDNDNIEYFEEALDKVIDSDNDNENNNDKKSKDHIKKWNDEFKYRDADQENVIPTSNKTATYADFTSDGKNHYNNLTHFDSADLLPKPDKDQPDDDGWKYKHGANWDESNPQIAQVEGNAWLNERKFLGMYTTGSTLRNATHDFRKDIPNPQMVVSPWNNTTILPDSNNKGLCTL
jgi:hypothetical protein